MGTPENSLANNQESETTTALMRSEAQRLSTFGGWQHNDKVEARKIAKAGFFHTGNDSEVKCPWCFVVLNHWEYGDQVMARHRTANPNCPFIQNISDNVPLINDAQSQVNTSQSESEDNEDRVNQSHDEAMDEDEEPTAESHTDTIFPPLPSTSTGNSPTTTSSSAPPLSSGTTTASMMMVTELSQYKSETSRLQTFRNWPLRHIVPADLANAGFIYTGRSDLVQCVFCEGIIGNWEEEDFPITEHRALYPHCPFVRGLDVGNIPLQNSTLTLGVPGSSSETTSLQRSPSRTDHPMDQGGEDEAGIRPHRHLNSGPEKNVLRYRNENGPSNEEKAGIIKHSGPANSKYSTPESRLRSFKDWPPALRQEPKQLAEAGFYYIGLSDQTKCFYCDGGLRNWQPEDDPWTEHARWFSKCGFVRLIKGDEFILRCINDKPPEAYPVDTERKIITKEQVKACMTSPVVQQALSMGVEQSRINMAIRKQLREKGANFKNVEALISTVMTCQNEEQQEETFEVVNETTTTANSSGPGVHLAAESRISLQQPTRMEQQPSTERSISAPGSVQSPPTPCTIEPSATLTKEGQTTSTPEGSDLEQENRRLKEARICKICMDNEVGVVFLPCGHLISCVNCVHKLKDCHCSRTTISCLNLV